MGKAHLTRVTHLDKGWRVECLCGWTHETKLRKDAIKAGEHHWLTNPLVSEVAWPQAN